MHASEAMLDVATDAELVAAAVAGERDAFAQIVERYQRLLCSIGYAAIGSVSASEDVAQETFITAWRELGSLREPEKLRSWLCGILRHQVNRHWRRAGRDPVWRADDLEGAAELPAMDEPIADVAMQKEEQDLLRRALGRVPPLYREPMVLYYRESRSIEHVAAALDLTEDAVKQRLSRGRKMIQEQMLALVEGALSRSGPGKLFTFGVLAVLPQLATPAKAAGAGLVAAHGTALAKTTGLAALVASFSGIYSSILALRIGLDQARTPRERRAVVKVALSCVLGSLGFVGVIYGLRAAALHTGVERQWPWAVLVQVLVVTAAIGFPVALLAALRHMRRLRSSERRAHPELFAHPRDTVASPQGEYKSQARFLGVPLVHLRFASPDEGQRPVFGWIAAGDRAYGLLFAWGTWAVAPISVGAVAMGILSVGGVSVGFISLGTLATGFLAVGCMSIGVKAFGWLSALGWEVAGSGGFAVARSAAQGPIAWARHVNDAAAHALVADPDAERNQMIFLIVIAIGVLVPVTLYARAVRRRMGRRDSVVGGR